MAKKPIAERSPAAAPGGGGRRGRPAMHAALGALALIVAACGGGNYAADDERVGPRAGPEREFDPDAPTVFGDDGLNIGTIRSTSTDIFGGGDEGEGRLPVNKYLWQASLDTLSFLPLASSDPFSGVIATEWGANPAAPGERYKVSAFVTSAALSAASLKVAVYREVQGEDGQWLPAPVSAETVRQLEDAILTRAREIRIAEREGRATG